MRVLSWNLRDLLGDPLAVHRVVRAAGADVACLQEAPRRPGARLRLHLLERATGMRCVAGGRRAGGTAVLVAPAVRVGWACGFRLPVDGWWRRTRGASVVVVRTPGEPAVAVASVHLPLEPPLRPDHVARVRRVLEHRGLPAVVAGDLNEPPGSPAWRAWEPLVADPWPDAPATYPASGPVHRLDAVLVGAGLRAQGVAEGWCDPDDVRLATDHRPVLAVVTAFNRA